VSFLTDDEKAHCCESEAAHIRLRAMNRERD